MSSASEGFRKLRETLGAQHTGELCTHGAGGRCELRPDVFNAHRCFACRCYLPNVSIACKPVTNRRRLYPAEARSAGTFLNSGGA